MPNAAKSIKAIRKALELTKAEREAKQLEIIKRSPLNNLFQHHPVHNPIAHWSGVSRRTLATLRANREAVGNAGGVYYGQEGVFIRPVANKDYYHPRFAPAAASIVEHSKLGFGIVEGRTSYSGNLGMTVEVSFEDLDLRVARVFVDELEILDGDLVGTSNEVHETIVSPERRLDIDQAKVMAEEFDA